MWEAIGKYADGSEIRKLFPSNAGDSWLKQSEEQYNIECWIMEMSEDKELVWYSVNYIEV